MGFGSSGQRFVSVIKKSLPLAEILVVSSQQAEIPGVRFTSQLKKSSARRNPGGVVPAGRNSWRAVHQPISGCDEL